MSEIRCPDFRSWVERVGGSGRREFSGCWTERGRELRFAWLTYQDPRGEALPAFGRTWDRHSRFAPEVIDDRDPPRSRWESVEASMVELAGAVRPGARTDTAMYVFGEGQGPNRPIVLRNSVEARCEYHRIETEQGDDRDRTDVYPQMPSNYGGSIKAPLLDGDEAWADFWALFVDVALQLEAFFAYVTPIELTNQFRGTGHTYLVVSDVEWINWYGPAFLEHWGGAERLAGVGVRQEQMANGSLVVWATEQPPALDPDVTARGHYPWKRPFYEALGRETFYLPPTDRRVLSCAEERELVGVHVPSPETQRRFARQYEGAGR